MRVASRSPTRLARRAATILALLATAGCAGRTQEPDAAAVEVGRRLYEDGILPGGLPLRGERPEGVALEGRSAACAGCHRRSGMGSVEGSLERAVLVPPVAGPLLFRPARFHESYLNAYVHWVPNEQWSRALTRGAYDGASLGRALREGLDADGRPLRAPMPRYALDDEALAALSRYLRTLATDPAPGVDAGRLHLATVVTPDVLPAEAEAVLGVLRAWSGSSRAYGRAWRLHLWRLEGAPGQWGAQLEARYREQPVFALLSGAGGAEWAPVQRFCDERRVPCVMPSLEVAPAGSDGSYAVYFSPGVPLEARVLARALAADAKDRRIVQVASDASGRRAAESFAGALAGAGAEPAARSFRLSAPAAALAGLAPDDLLVLWLRPSALEALVAAVPAGPPSRRVFLSAFLAPPESLALPPAWKARVTWVSLFDDLGVQGQLAKLRLRQWLERSGLPLRDSLRAEGDAYAAAYWLASALEAIREEEQRRPEVPLGREHLLEALERQVAKYADGTALVDPDAHVAYYGRMSLGPGQRTAVRGGILLRHASPDSDALVAVGARIVP